LKAVLWNECSSSSSSSSSSSI